MLEFRKDGTFVIAQFADTHWENGNAEDIKTKVLMEYILDTEKPDLVIFTGDMVRSTEDCINPIDSIHCVVAPVESRKIPWAFVFGNHDTETKITREEFMKEILKFEMNLSEVGPKCVKGVGNYIIKIAKHEEENPGAVLYLFDSGKYDDWIHYSQILWYVKNSKRITREYGSPIPSLAFFHIPLSEYNDIWDFTTCYGNKLEDVCCPKINSGFLSAVREMGDISGIFVGHDHINDYHGEIEGIKLYYGRGTGYNTYGKEGFAHGARMIRLKQGDRNFDSWIRLDDGTVIENQLPHEAIGRILKK